MFGDKVILFIDTNAFLQMRDLKDISWRDLFGDAVTVDLMVAPRIIDELDNQKVGTSDRRRTRSKSALKLIDDAANELRHTLTIRSGPPVEVRLVLYPGGKFDWDAYPILDQTSADDQLVAAALAFGNGALVFSHDRGPRIRARLSGIAAPEPLDDWMLPPEKTDDQRRVGQLERDLERALSTKPNILAEFEGVIDTTRELNLYIPVVKGLDPSYVEALSDSYLNAHPMESLNRPQPSRLYPFHYGISSDAIDRYEEDYRGFKTSVRQYFATLHEEVVRQGHVVSVLYNIRNDSGTSAASLRVEFVLRGEGRILADREDTKGLYGDIAPPEPPEPPKSMLDITRSHLGGLNYVDKDRDPVKFYWHDRPNLMSTQSAMQCEDFRATRTYQDEVFVLITTELPFSTTLQMEVSARNAQAPVNTTANITVEKREVEWLDDVVLDLLPDEIAADIKRQLG